MKELKALIDSEQIPLKTSTNSNKPNIQAIILDFNEDIAAITQFFHDKGYELQDYEILKTESDKDKADIVFRFQVSTTINISRVIKKQPKTNRKLFSFLAAL